MFLFPLVYLNSLFTPLSGIGHNLILLKTVTHPSGKPHNGNKMARKWDKGEETEMSPT